MRRAAGQGEGRRRRRVPHSAMNPSTRSAGTGLLASEALQPQPVLVFLAEPESTAEMEASATTIRLPEARLRPLQRSRRRREEARFRRPGIHRSPSSRCFCS